MVQLQWHEAPFTNGTYHTLIKIVPDDQKRWAKDDRFLNRGKNNSKMYLTLGAGPRWGKLVSDINRDSDSAQHTEKFTTIPVPKKYKNENEFIEALLLNDSKYKDNLDYDLFPKKEADQKWYIADDGYNSNSYISGLLSSVGVKGIAPPVNAPGFLRPILQNHFK